MAKGNGDGGRFALGNAGGPGRPRKSKVLDNSTLRDLMEAAQGGGELYLTAMALRDRDSWLARVESDFPKPIVDRIKTLVALSDLARGEIVRRLRDLPM